MWIQLDLFLNMALTKWIRRISSWLLEKEMAVHSSVLAWRILWMEEPGGLPSRGSHGIGHDWSDLAAAAAGLWVHGPTLQCSSSSSTLLFSMNCWVYHFNLSLNNILSSSMTFCNILWQYHNPRGRNQTISEPQAYIHLSYITQQGRPSHYELRCTDLEQVYDLIYIPIVPMSKTSISLQAF